MRIRYRLAIAFMAMALLFAPAIGASAQQTPAAKTAARQKTAQAAKTAPEAGQDRADQITEMVLDRLLVVADAHFHKGEYNHIVNLSRMILSARPEELEIYATAGWLLWSMDRDQEAVALYEQGLKANPKTSFMYDELGQYFFIRKKDYRKAAEYYEQAVKFPDVQRLTVHQLAHSYERSGQLDKCLAVWERAAQDPDNPAAKRNLERIRQKVRSAAPEGRPVRSNS